MLSEERQTHLAHVIVDGLWNDDLVEYPDEDQAIREAKRVLVEYAKHEENVDETVRAKILNQKKAILEGSREFDVLYKKYYDEEQAKRKR